MKIGKLHQLEMFSTKETTCKEKPDKFTAKQELELQQVIIENIEKTGIDIKRLIPDYDQLYNNYFKDKNINDIRIFYILILN